MSAKAAPHLTALRQTIESMLSQATLDYSLQVELYNFNKCSVVKVSYMQGMVEGLKKAREEAVHAETYAEGSDCQIDAQNPPAEESVGDK